MRTLKTSEFLASRRGQVAVLVDSGQIYTGCRREECCTIVLHRHFPAVRETLDFEGLFRCRKSLAKWEGFAYLLPLVCAQASPSVDAAAMAP